VFYSSRHGRKDVFLISTDGTNEVRLTDGPSWDTYPSFSPDGLRIAFTREVDGQFGVYVLSRDSVGAEWSAPRPLTPDADGRLGVSWSPDGSRIVSRALDPQWWIISLQGEQRLLLDGAAVGLRPSGGFSWSADGRLIYFVARDSTGSKNMYVIPAAGGTPQMFIRFDEPTKLSWSLYSMGAGKVYFTVGETESDIYVMDLEMQ